MQPATTEDVKTREDERLLIRLAEVWWRSRPGSPGLRWVTVREAMKDPKIQDALASLNWKPAASDKELYAAFCAAAIGKGPWKEQDFDSWEMGNVDAEQLTFRQKSDHRKRDASRIRKSTEPTAVTTTPKAKPAAKVATQVAWPVIKTSPPLTRAEEADKQTNI